ncbi:hypothetical protein ABZW30_36055 [Kitasatospora sp. NPDC004669]|uniref:hypothetical protein n=1 Tax=Kitasatospora sp. NPDC004669 TaxID=3154555 RepID=UPI0033BCBF34
MTTEPAQPPPAPADAPPAPAVPPAVPPAQPEPAAQPEPPAQPVPPQPQTPRATGELTADPDLPSAAPEAAPRAPRRPRPVLLSTCALVLGALAGGGVGYAIQAQRPPTPLPKLQVARPSYPALVVDPTAFAAEQPAPPAIDGDLRKLLISAPDGSGPWGDLPDKPSWMSAGDLADHSGRPGPVFKDLLSTGFRRAVEVDWKKDDIRYRVLLTQYAPDHSDEAKSHRAEPFADGANGGYTVYNVPRYWSDSNDQYYYGFATAKRGTVQMTVEIFSPKQVDSGALKDLAKQQWERLV